MKQVEVGFAFVVFDDVRNENACGNNDKDDEESLANLLLLL